MRFLPGGIACVTITGQVGVIRLFMLREQLLVPFPYNAYNDFTSSKHLLLTSFAEAPTC